MTQRNCVLPSVNGRQDASFLNYRSSPSHKQHHSADILWKNPPLKFPKKSCHLERRKRYLGEQRRDLFLGYEVSTPQLRETGKGNRTIEINEFVRSYVHKRESQLPLLKPSQRTLVQRNSIVPDCLFVSKRPREINLPTLEFTEEVIASRADPMFVVVLFRGHEKNLQPRWSVHFKEAKEEVPIEGKCQKNLSSKTQAMHAKGDKQRPGLYIKGKVFLAKRTP